jgi:hypothetical protein
VFCNLAETLRIVVPDFEAVVGECIENRNLMSVQGLLYGGQTYDYNFHYVAFDYKMIKSLLEESGFCKVQRFDWQDFLPTEGFDGCKRG